MRSYAAETSAGQGAPIWPLLLFGAMAMVGLAALQYLRFHKDRKRTFSLAFLKTYGLVLVATLGAVLAFAPGDAETRTGAFTLLGIIAGYLATTPGGDVGKEQPGPGGPAGGGDPRPQPAADTVTLTGGAG